MSNETHSDIPCDTTMETGDEVNELQSIHHREQHSVSDVINHVVQINEPKNSKSNENNIIEGDENVERTFETDEPNRSYVINVATAAQNDDVILPTTPTTSLPSHTNDNMEQIFVTNVPEESHVITVSQQSITPAVMSCENTESSTTVCHCNCHSTTTTTSTTGGRENRAYQSDDNVTMAMTTISENDDVEDLPSDINVQYKKYVRELSRISTTSTTSTKPPTYSSLGQYILHDEPPKYQNITGNKLATELELVPPHTPRATTQQSNRMNCKSKVAGCFILFGVILITCLLVYLSITSDNQEKPRT